MLNRKVILIAIGLAPFTQLVALGAALELKESHVTAEIKTVQSDYSNKPYNSSNITLEAMTPFKRDSNSVSSIAMQMSYFDKLYQTYGLGVAQRNVIGDKVYGLYGFYDYQKSLNDHIYHRFNVGFELMAEKWLLRTNFYLYPNSNAHKIRDISSTTTSLVAEVEQAYSGAEVEWGHELGLKGLNGYAAYYNYGNKIIGAKLRLEYQINTHVALMASTQHDAARGHLTSAGIIVFMGQAVSGSNSIADRLQRPIVRDMTVLAEQYQQRTNQASTESTSSEEVTPEATPTVPDEAPEAPVDDAPIEFIAEG